MNPLEAAHLEDVLVGQVFGRSIGERQNLAGNNGRIALQHVEKMRVERLGVFTGLVFQERRDGGPVASHKEESESVAEFFLVGVGLPVLGIGLGTRPAWKTGRPARSTRVVARTGLDSTTHTATLHPAPSTRMHLFNSLQ